MIAAPSADNAPRRVRRSAARVTIPTVSASAELDNVSKTFGTVEALAPTDLSIEGG